MSRIYLRSIVLAFVIFSIALLIIHAQPYDDHQLRAALLPENCPASCFMGIRPGVTTTNEAEAILKSNQWVRKLADNYAYGIEIRDFAWDWSDQKPMWIGNAARGYGDASNGTVTSITIETNFTLGAVRLALGVPNWEAVGVLGDQKYGFYSGFYKRYGLFIQQTFACGVIQPFKGKVSIRSVSPTILIASETGHFSDIFRVC